MHIEGIDHVEISAPAGSEARVRAFYGGVLGLREMTQPQAHASGVWYECGGAPLFVNLSGQFAPTRLALRVTDVVAARKALMRHGVLIEADSALGGVQRFHGRDPFGNPLEFVATPSPAEKKAAPEPGKWGLMSIASQPQVLEEYTTKGGSVERVALSPDEAWLVVGAASAIDERSKETVRDATLYIWRYGESEAPEWEIEMSASIWEVAFSPDGKELASLSEDGNLEIARVESFESIGLLHLPEYSCGLAYSSDGSLLAVGAGDEVALFRPGLKHHRTLKPEIGPINALAFAPQDLLAASGSELVIKLWELKPLQRPSGELRGHNAPVEELAFNPKYPALAAACGEGGILIWNLEGDLNAPRALRGHAGEVYALCFSPDGELLAMGSADGWVLLWDWQAERVISRINLEGSSVSSLIFSADGERLITGDDDGVTSVWKII